MVGARRGWNLQARGNQPLGTDWPVCAWGMGLERLAMLILGLDDIRELYQPDLMVLSRMPIL